MKKKYLKKVNSRWVFKAIEYTMVSFFFISKILGYQNLTYPTKKVCSSKFLQANPPWVFFPWLFTLRSTKCKKLEVSKFIPSMRKSILKKSMVLKRSVFKIDFFQILDQFFKKKFGSIFSFLVVVSDEQRKFWKK